MKTDVLIIGGGPAGLSAGLTARSFGLDVTVIDENPKIGGSLLNKLISSLALSSTGAESGALTLPINFLNLQSRKK